MITYGYAKDYYYTDAGTLMVKVRIPSIHGAYSQADYKGKTIRNYVVDSDLPYYPSLLLQHLPTDGDIVALMSSNNSKNNLLVIGLTGGSYNSGNTNLED